MACRAPKGYKSYKGCEGYEAAKALKNKIESNTQEQSCKGEHCL